MKDPEGYFVRKRSLVRTVIVTKVGQLTIERDFPNVVWTLVLPRIFYYEQSALFVFLFCNFVV